MYLRRVCIEYMKLYPVLTDWMLTSFPSITTSIGVKKMTMTNNKAQNKILYSLVLLCLSFISIVANPQKSCRSLPNSIRQTCAFGVSDALTQATTGAVTYIGLIAYFDRPRGRLDIDESAIETRQSKVDGAGIGLFATKSLPEGTLLGTYPGVLRPAQKYMAQYGGKPSAGEYSWRFTDNAQFIDPIDSEGQLQNRCCGGTADFFLSYFLHEKVLRWSVPTLLARINEPPIGGTGCNVRSEENLNTREVAFELSRDVVEGEELFMDYGLSYDRSDYGKV